MRQLRSANRRRRRTRHPLTPCGRGGVLAPQRFNAGGNPVDLPADDHFKLQVEWPSLVQAGRAKLPLGQTDFGGVSGGPAFLWDGGGNPLVGLIAEAGDTLPVWRVAALAGVSFDPEAVGVEPVLP